MPGLRLRYAEDNTEEERAAWVVKAYQMAKIWGYVGMVSLWNLNFRIVAPGSEQALFGILDNDHDYVPTQTYWALRYMPSQPLIRAATGGHRVGACGGSSRAPIPMRNKRYDDSRAPAPGHRPPGRLGSGRPLRRLGLLAAPVRPARPPTCASATSPTGVLGFLGQRRPGAGSCAGAPTPATWPARAEDDRGAGLASTTHHVTISGLAASTSYYVDVVSGATVDNNGGAHYRVTTGPALDPGPLLAALWQGFPPGRDPASRNSGLWHRCRMATAAARRGRPACSPASCRRRTRATGT